jgi:hypothetical protein
MTLSKTPRLLLAFRLPAVALLCTAMGSLVGGCVQPQRPYQFTTAQMARDPIEALGASFSQLGMVPALVDPKAGLVQSRWEDTGRRGLPIKDRDTVIVRRFVARLEHGSFGNDVTLSTEARRCVQLSFTLTESDLTGTCEPMARLDEPLLKELAALGSRLQQAMSIP